MFKTLKLGRCVQTYVILVGLLTIIVFVFYSNYLLKKISHDHLLSIINTTISNFEDNNYRNIVSHNHFELQRNLEKVFMDSKIVLLKYQDNNRKDIYARSKDDKFPDIESDEIVQIGNAFVISKPIMSKGSNSLLGYLVLGIDSAATQSLLMAYRYRYAWFLLVLVLVAVIFAGYSSKILLGSLKKLQKRFKSTTKLDSELLKEDEYRFEEVRTIAVEYNSMLQRLKEYEGKVKNSEKMAAMGKSTAMIAHDVRKPLASLKSFLTILPEKRDDDKFINYMVSNLEGTIVRTNAMLDEIMDFSKESMSLEIIPRNPQSIITAAISDSLRDKKNVNISLKYDLLNQNYLNVDGNRIVRVIANIIGNAVEAMGGEGKIWIKTEDIVSTNKMCLIVGNNGPLIAESSLHRLFEAFYTSGKKGGTGLGLAICKKIVEQHGGSIKVVSQKLQGEKQTEFIIELPSSPGELNVNKYELIHHSDELKKFHEEASFRKEYSSSVNISDFMRINKSRGRSSYLLIVDDEPLFRETIRSLLVHIPQVRECVKIVEAESAETALDLLKQHEFDYVVADIDLGRYKMNGYEMSRQILEDYPNVYVLIHSNKRREELDINIREINSDHFMGFLPKPMNRSELLQFLACKTFEERANCEIKKENKNVLVVNDDDALLLTFKIMLKCNSIKVMTASSVDEAQKILSKSNIDIIFSDINLGENEPNGYQLLCDVRKYDQAVPVYIVSGYSKAEEEPKARSMGANGYLQLPIEKEQLDAILLN